MSRAPVVAEKVHSITLLVDEMIKNDSKNSKANKDLAKVSKLMTSISNCGSQAVLTDALLRQKLDVLEVEVTKMKKVNAGLFKRSMKWLTDKTFSAAFEEAEQQFKTLLTVGPRLKNSVSDGSYSHGSVHVPEDEKKAPASGPAAGALPSAKVAPVYPVTPVVFPAVAPAVVKPSEQLEKPGLGGEERQGGNEEKKLGEVDTPPERGESKIPQWEKVCEEYFAHKVVVGRLAHIRRLSKPAIPDALSDYQEFTDQFVKAGIVLGAGNPEQRKTALANRAMANQCMIDIEDELLERLNFGIIPNCRLVEIASSGIRDHSLEKIVPSLIRFTELRQELESISKERQQVPKDQIADSHVNQFWKRLRPLGQVVDDLASDVEYFVFESLVEDGDKLTNALAAVVAGQDNFPDTEVEALSQQLQEVINTLVQCETQIHASVALSLPSVNPDF